MNAMERIRKATLILIGEHPHFGCLWPRFSIVEDPAVETMCVTSDGQIRAGTKFASTLPGAQLPGCLAHEMLHVIAEHFARRGEREPELWGWATDMAINHALRADGLELPEWVLYPPQEYMGPMNAEALYDFLKKNPDKQPESNGAGQPKVGAGCAAQPNNEKESGGAASSTASRWITAAAEARALANVCGTGTHVAKLLTPAPVRQDWRKVLRTGFQIASSNVTKDSPTYARRHRRSPVEGPQLPGWVSHSPSLAIVIDASSSMERPWMQQIAGHVLKIAKQYPGVKIFLATHTSVLNWAGWITDKDKDRVIAATGFSGGTNPEPAYEAVARAGKFDALVHFTDGEFFRDWPKVPARKLIVGQFGEQSTPPPAGSVVMPCASEQGGE